jgi:CRP-like cAMP-binding protein
MSTDELSALRHIGLFQRLPDAALERVKATLIPRDLDAGDILFNMSDPGDELYIVRTGQIAVYVPHPEHQEEERPIGFFEPPDVLGETTLIDRQPRSLSARAVVPSQLWALTARDFLVLIQDQPQVALAVMGGLNDRVRYTSLFLSEVREWVKRIAGGQYDRDFKPDIAYDDPFIAVLAAEFAQMAAQIEKREQELRSQVLHLQIQIDTAKGERYVSEITESDYFQALRANARKLTRQE